MRVVVCVKHVPDTNEPKRLESDLTLQRSGVQSVINPMDEYALEIALKWKDADPSLEIVVLTMGPEDARGIIKKCLAKGADRAVLVSDEALSASDSLGTARVLAAAIRKVGDVDLVLCGLRSSDGDCYLVGPAVAELLDMPQITAVKDAELDQAGRKAIANREVDGAIEVVRVGFPALLSATKASYEPRLASFKGITAANKKEILAWSIGDVGVPGDQVGAAGTTIKVLAYIEPPPRPKSEVLSGAPADLARRMVEFLHAQKLI